MSSKPARKPRITLAESDHARLEALAIALEARNPAVAGLMLAELDRARIVPDRAMPADIVRMGSKVTFSIDGSQPRTAGLVYPGEADIERGLISVATPVGAALIGLPSGQTLEWNVGDGRTRTVTVLAVERLDASEPA
jgi:regulator of nucleoside diphosphate kinase